MDQHVQTDPSANRVDEETRRRLGITYTPTWIVSEMIRWAKEYGNPSRIVDAGAGNGVFTFAAAAAFPDAQVLAVEIERKSAYYLSQKVKKSAFRDQIKVLVRDYLLLPELPPISGQTLFIGNPPYVRHHLISDRRKKAYIATSSEYGLVQNTKAGLHLHFFLKTRKLAKKNDYGIFLAAAEWLHADYGCALRTLLLDGMGGLSIDTFSPKQKIFPEVMTTAAVVCFEVGSKNPSMKFSEVNDFQSFAVGSGTSFSNKELSMAKHWSAYARDVSINRPIVPSVKLKDIFKISRGQVTGAKEIWVHGPHAPEMPQELLFPTITKAREITGSGGEIRTSEGLSKVVDLPLNFADLPPDARLAAIRYREWARRKGGDRPLIARARKRWCSVQLYRPAPIICTYMGRRPPVFALNTARVHILNIAHGLVPKVSMDDSQLAAIVEWLNANVTEAHGRRYAEALVKFEPSDIGEIPLPCYLVPSDAQTAPPQLSFL